MILLAILVFIVILGLLVFVHELGHFIMAKRSGMRVQEFGFGFPPRLFGIRRGETVYSINWIPLGGFVKIVGEDGGPTSDPRAFMNKGFWQRLSTLLAGVGMNFVLAWFLLFLGFAVVKTPVEYVDQGDLAGGRIHEQYLAVVAVEPESPAERTGFKPGDIIFRVDGQVFTEIDPLIEYTRSRAGQSVVYELKRGDQILVKDAVPRSTPPPGGGAVGFAPAKIAVVTYPILSSLKYSVIAFSNKVMGIVFAFGGLLGELFSTGKVVEGLSGPIGIAVLTRDFAILGIVYLVQFTAVLSINLAIINALPFPALDGGRVLFLIIEKIRGRASVKWERIANVVGFSLLILLIIAVSFQDIGRYSENFRNLFGKAF